MLSLHKLLIATVVSATLSACSTPSNPQTESPLASADPVNVQQCQEPRPEICTREYNPVCATRKDGTQKTYATGCTACGDAEVVSHVAGPCAQ